MKRWHQVQSIWKEKYKSFCRGQELGALQLCWSYRKVNVSWSLWIEFLLTNSYHPRSIASVSPYSQLPHQWISYSHGLKVICVKFWFRRWDGCKKLLSLSSFHCQQTTVSEKVVFQCDKKKKKQLTRNQLLKSIAYFHLFWARASPPAFSNVCEDREKMKKKQK